MLHNGLSTSPFAGLGLLSGLSGLGPRTPPAGALPNFPMLQFLSQTFAQPGGPPPGLLGLMSLGGLPTFLPPVSLPHTLAPPSPVAQTGAPAGGSAINASLPYAQFLPNGSLNDRR